MAVNVFFASAGISVVKHICPMLKSAKISFYEAKPCCENGMKTGCCKNETVTFKLDNLAKSNFQFSIPNFQFIGTFIISDVQFSVFNYHHLSFDFFSDIGARGSPPLLQVFRL